MAITGSGDYAGLVKTTYDKYVEFALRSTPLFRDVADKRPVDLGMAGNVVTFSFYSDLSAVTGNLSEEVDPSAVVPSDVTTVNVTLAEKGNVVTRTEFLDLTSFSAVDPAIADLVAFNMRDSLDVQARAVLIAGTNHITSDAGAVEATPAAINSLAATDVFSSAIVRYVVAKLRGASVAPRKEELYWCAIHPDVSHDLRKETSSGGWRLPHEYQAGNQIWKGEIGTYEGAFFIETPRAYKAADGSSSAVVHRTLFAGKQALAEAVAREPGMVIGPVTDSLARFRPVGWKGTLGWARYREEALYRASTGASI